MITRFVAIGVAPEVRDTVEASIVPVRDRWPGCSWTDPLGWHVTLAFLGRLPATSVPEVVAAVDCGVAAASVDGGLPRHLLLGSASSFGARVLMVRVDDQPPGSVARLGAHVQAALVGAGLPVQERPVRPHLTLARARRAQPVQAALVDATQRAIASGPDASSWEVATVGIWSSHPRPDGPVRYLVDAEVPVAR